MFHQHKALLVTWRTFFTSFSFVLQIRILADTHTHTQSLDFLQHLLIQLQLQPFHVMPLPALHIQTMNVLPIPLCKIALVLDGGVCEQQFTNLHRFWLRVEYSKIWQCFDLNLSMIAMAVNVMPATLLEGKPVALVNYIRSFAVSNRFLSGFPCISLHQFSH